MTEFVRSIGRWSLTGLVINAIVGAGIFGVPGELSRFLGRASPIAMLAGAACMAIIVACFTEVASQFSGPGGAYLYARKAFGRFVGMQVGWLWLLGAIGGAAACANLFLDYLAALVPSMTHGWARVVAITVLIAIPTVANYFGVRSGANLGNLFTIAKLMPLLLIIGMGVWRFTFNATLIHWSEIANPGRVKWMSALLLLLFSYGGYEDALVPTGEVKEPQKSVPFGILFGLVSTATLYCLLQFVTVATVGNGATDRPLAEAASALLGRSGALLVTLAVMVSTYGWIAGSVLNAPRLPYAFSANGDLPRFLGRLHPKYRTPAPAILLFAVLVWGLAVTGTFLWILEATAGSMAVLYIAVCAALIRLRKIQPAADAVRIPLGRLLACLGILICIALLTQLKLTEALLTAATSSVAFANWCWAKRRERRAAPVFRLEKAEDTGATNRLSA